MRKSKEIVDILKQMKPLIGENNGPTSIFVAGGDYRKVNISAMTVDKDFITETTGKYLFKRKYRINKNEF